MATPKKKPGLGDLVLDADAADQRFQDANIQAPVAALETRQDFAAAIAALWRAAQENFISIGRRLNEAKMRLPHGEFEAMVEADMPFDVSTARRFRAVAEAIDNGTAPVAYLPPSPTIIYEVITKTTEQERAEGIKAGVISPTMRRDDFRRWIARVRAPEQSTPPEPTPIERYIAGTASPPADAEPCAGARFEDKPASSSKALPVDPRIRLDALRARRAELTAEIAKIDAEIMQIEAGLGDDGGKEPPPIERKLRLIALIISETWTKHVKWRVEVAMVDGPKLVLWMTDKQHQKLVQCFERTNNGNSTKNCQVYGVFEGERFVWCGVHTRRHSDVAYLREKFNAVGTIVWSLEELDGPVPLPPAAATEPEDDLVDD